MPRPSVWFLLSLFALLNLIDAANTTYVLSHAGGWEFNPAVAWLLTHTHSLLTLWLWKITIIFYIGYLVYKTEFHPRSTSVYRVMVGANILLLTVTLWGGYLVYTI